MAVPFVQAISAGSSGTNVQATLGAAPTQGNLLVAYVCQQSTNTFTAQGSWAALTEVTSSDEGLFFWKLAGAGESATQTPCTTSSSTRNWVCIIHEYNSSPASGNLLAENGQADTNATKTSPSVTPTSSLRALLVGGAFSTSAGTTFNTQKVNGSATGVNERKDQGSGSGSNQTHGCTWDFEIISTSGSYSTTCVASAAENGGISIAIFKLNATGQTVSVGQTTETDTAQAFARAKTKAVGQPSETHTAQAMVRVKTKAVGQPAETDTAQAITRAKSLAIGQATETETALPMTVVQTGGGQTVAVGQAAETNAALPLMSAKLKVLGQPEETEAALPIRALKTKAIGQASEADSAFSFARLKTLTVGQALEADAALALSRLKQLAIGQASESDLAQAITFVPAVVEGVLALDDEPVATLTPATTAGATLVLADQALATLALADAVA